MNQPQHIPGAFEPPSRDATDTIPAETAPPSPGSLAPYLTLPYLLSLTWLATPIVSLLFVAFRLSTSADSAQDAVGDTKANLLASCAAAEQAATVAASLPRYMAAGTNRQIIEAVNGTMDVTRKTLVFLLTIVEAIIEFVVDTYRSTFLCFLELVVRGGLAIIIGAVQEISAAVTSSLNTIRSSIQNDVAAANSVISSAVSAINKVTSIVNVNLNVPQFTIPSLTLLQNVTIPADFENSLLKLNSSLPTLSELRDAVNSIIETPFTALKVDINNTFATFSFNESLLTVPAQRTMTFCQDMDTSIVDDLGRDIVKITKIGVGLLVLLAFLMVLANCFVQWWQWRCMKVNLQRTRHAWASDPTVVHVPVGAGERPSLQMTDHNLMTLLTTQHHPLLTHWANIISKTFRLSPSQHNKLRWFCAYVFHMPALTCLLIGLLGILSVQIQLAAIRPIQAHYSSQVASSIGSFTNSIADNINTSMRNQSAEYVNGVNGHSIALQTSINNNLFGWVNGTTTALNNTLVTVYADIQKIVNTTFGGTVLDAPAQEFVRCILGSKIEGLEKALTFLNENLKVSVPTLSPDVLTLSNSSVAEITKPISAAAVGSGDAGGDSGGLVGRIVDRYVAALKKERLMFLIFLGLWGLVVLMALCILLWHSYFAPCLHRGRSSRLKRGREREERLAVVPWYQLSSSADKKLKEQHQVHLRRKSSGFYPAERLDDDYATGSQQPAEARAPTPPFLSNSNAGPSSPARASGRPKPQSWETMLDMKATTAARGSSQADADASSKAGTGTWFGLLGRKKEDAGAVVKEAQYTSPFPSDKPDANSGPKEKVVRNKDPSDPAQGQGAGLLKGLAGLWRSVSSRSERNLLIGGQQPTRAESTLFPDSPIDPRLTMITPEPHFEPSRTTTPPPPLPPRNRPAEDFPESVDADSVHSTAPVHIGNPLPLHHHFSSMDETRGPLRAEVNYSAPALARAVSINDPFASPTGDSHPIPPMPNFSSTNPFGRPPSLPPLGSNGAPPSRNLITSTYSPTSSPVRPRDSTNNPTTGPFDDRYRITPFDDRYNPRRESGRLAAGNRGPLPGAAF